MTEPYGLPAGTTINYKQLGFPAWVDELCRQWELDSSTYPGHQEGDRPDIGSAPNPEGLNRGIDWAGPADKMLAFAHWLVSIGPERQPGQYGPPGLEMVIYRHPTEDVIYPSWVDFSGDLPEHTDHVHTRFSASVIDVAPSPSPGSDLIGALSRAGIDPVMYPLIVGFAVVEGNNPSGVPTLGFTDAQAGSSLDEHARALAQQFKDREPVAGPFPRQGTPADQAAWMADVVGQAGLSSDWQGNAQPPRQDYVNNIVKNMPVISPPPPPESPGPDGAGGELTVEQMIRELHYHWVVERIPSKSRYGDPTVLWYRRDMAQNDDGFLYDEDQEKGALLGDLEARARVEAARGRGDVRATNFLRMLEAGPPQPAPVPDGHPTPSPGPAPSPTPQPQAAPSGSSTINLSSIVDEMSQLRSLITQLAGKINDLSK